MEIDIENFDSLDHYLRRYGHVDSNDTITFVRLAGGVSNKTVKVTWPDGHGWVLKQALAKLRVSVDWWSNPDRIQVEARALRWLNRSLPQGMTPAFIFEDAANHVIAMDAIPDEHENWKSVLLSGRIVPDQFKQFGTMLGLIHRTSSDPKSEVRSLFADAVYFETLRLEPYYSYTGQRIPAAASFLNELALETLRHKYCLVHGDFSPKNTLVYRGKLVLLDYEVCHFGDPAFDIGFALAHFLSKAHHLPKKRASLAKATTLFVDVYLQEIASLDWSKSFGPRLVSHALGCLLARVAGKSPLEYLLPCEAERQQAVLLELIEKRPMSINNLITEFIEQIEFYAAH